MKVCSFDGAKPIGKPKGWDNQLDGECGELYVVKGKDTLSGYDFLYSVYRPTEEELERLNEGGALRLGVMGPGHPVINMLVLSQEVCEEGGVRDEWNMETGEKISQDD